MLLLLLLLMLMAMMQAEILERVVEFTLAVSQAEFVSVFTLGTDCFRFDDDEK